ncbi:MAG: glycosyltransferase family 9 protein [Bdellovibrionales bacterium]
MDRGNLDILLIRMDKMGDLVVSLPVDEHPAFSGQRVHWFITKGLSFVAEQAAPKRQATEFRRRFSVFEFLRMVKWLKRQRPRTVVLLHAPWWVFLAAWMANVPERIGRKSQWHSFLFLNVGIRQKRSLSDRHESDYNFDLVEYGFARLGVRRTHNLNLVKKAYLRLVAPNPFGTVQARGLKSKGYRVVHPGMGGSALNWPSENFIELIQSLAKDLPVIVTGTRADAKYLQFIESTREIRGVRWLVDELRPLELLDILSEARSVVAPSTGVLHLAASLGTPCVGIYSPRRVEHPLRWGPKGLFATHLVPPAQCADNFTPGIMKQITPELVYQSVLKLERGHVHPDAEAQSSV